MARAPLPPVHAAGTAARGALTGPAASLRELHILRVGFLYPVPALPRQVPTGRLAQITEAGDLGGRGHVHGFLGPLHGKVVIPVWRREAKGSLVTQSSGRFAPQPATEPCQGEHLTLHRTPVWENPPQGICTGDTTTGHQHGRKRPLLHPCAEVMWVKPLIPPEGRSPSTRPCCASAPKEWQQGTPGNQIPSCVSHALPSVELGVNCISEYIRDHTFPQSPRSLKTPQASVAPAGPDPGNSAC